MTQIFSPSADTWLRLLALGMFAALGGGLAVVIAFARSDYYTGANIHPPDQPVPFSHEHHVGGLGIDCRYCHTSVADGPRAGLPPTHTCMTCHSQIWTNAQLLEPVRQSWAQEKPIVWQRVNNLPDFVYFNHSAHLAAGVGCVSCHGRIDEMEVVMQDQPLTMGWCLDCHRDPAPSVRDPADVTVMSWKPDLSKSGQTAVAKNGRTLHPPTHCSGCHR